MDIQEAVFPEKVASAARLQINHYILWQPDSFAQTVGRK